MDEKGRSSARATAGSFFAVHVPRNKLTFQPIMAGLTALGADTIPGQRPIFSQHGNFLSREQSGFLLQLRAS